MSFAPFAVMWVLLVAGAIVCAAAGQRTRIYVAASLAAPLLAFLLWIIFRPDDAAAAPIAFAGRQWAAGAVGWQLTGVALLLALTAAVRALLDDQPNADGSQLALTLALTAAALPSLWAADERTRLLSITLFALVWVVTRRVASSRAAGSLSRSALWGVPVLGALWLAAAVPAGRALFTMAAAAVLMGIWPLIDDSEGDNSPPDLARRGLPLVVGAALLAGAVGSAALARLDIVAGTAFGLLSLVAGLALAWTRPRALPRALALGLAGLTFVAAIWAGPQALLAGTRLAVFAPALLTLGFSAAALSTNGDNARFAISPRLLAAAVAFLAVAGLPLTVGFGVFAPLYEAWAAAGGWVLLVVLAALISLWLATIALSGRAPERPNATNRAEMLRYAVLLLPLIGLVSLDFAPLGSGLATWLALALPVVAGLLLGRFAPALEAQGDLLREAAGMPQSAALVMPRLGEARRALSAAIADALAILEGDYGLLWLLGFILLLIWMA